MTKTIIAALALAALATEASAQQRTFDTTPVAHQVTVRYLRGRHRSGGEPFWLA